jgi:hypothetical protein
MGNFLIGFIVGAVVVDLAWAWRTGFLAVVIAQLKQR